MSLYVVYVIAIITGTFTMIYFGKQTKNAFQHTSGDFHYDLLKMLTFFWCSVVGAFVIFVGVFMLLTSIL